MLLGTPGLGWVRGELLFAPWLLKYWHMLHPDRRQFLRSVGACLALPFLESSARAKPPESPKRMVCLMTNMGVLPGNFFPQTPGADYEKTPYLEILAKHRSKTTVFSGLSHPGVDGAHLSERSFLSGAPHPAANNFRNSISVDQVVAERNQGQTRFPSLVLLSGKPDLGFPSVTRNGIEIPPERNPVALYSKLFLQGSPQQVTEKIEDLRRGQSVLDFVQNEARTLKRNASIRDKERIDQYFTSIRDLERSLTLTQEWELRPKPAKPQWEPKPIESDAEVEAQLNQMMDLMRLALETDSSRVISLYLGPLMVTPKIAGVTGQTHGLTHHGGDPEKIEQLRKIDEVQFRALDRFLSGLEAVQEQGGTLLDHSCVLYGSNLGNANSHDTTNLPVLLAGGGFRHGNHLAFDGKNNTPLANLFVTLLHRMGLEVERFASSTGSLKGLEVGA